MFFITHKIRILISLFFAVKNLKTNLFNKKKFKYQITSEKLPQGLKSFYMECASSKPKVAGYHIILSDAAVYKCFNKKNR